MDTQQSAETEMDVVIIGGGPGGLTAAVLLSQAGLRVTIAETQPRVGGYLAGFERQGFRFNSSIEWLSECGPDGGTRAIFDHMGGEFPHCETLRHIFRVKSPDWEYLLTDNPQEMREQLIREFPDDKAGIDLLFAEAQNLTWRMRALSRNLRSTETMSIGEKIKHGFKMARLGLPLNRYVRTPIEKGLKRYFATQRARAVFCSQETLMSVLVPITWAALANYQKCPTGGSEVLAEWMCDIATRNGTQVLVNCEVDKVQLNERGTACGVQLADGRKISAKYVVAACDTLTLYEKMLPPGTIKPGMIKALRNADLYHSYFSVFLGLDCPASDLGFGEEVLTLVRPGLPREDYLSGDPNRSIINVLSPSQRDATAAPAGKGSLSVHCPAYMEQGDNWKTGPGFKRGDEYKKFKQEFANLLLDRVEAEHCPGLRDHVEMMNISTPITYWRYTKNAQGTTSSIKPTGTNIRARVARHQTPVKRLLVGGHCGEYGGGVPMATKAGANASLIILKDLNPTAFTKLKDVLSGQSS